MKNISLDNIEDAMFSVRMKIAKKTSFNEADKHISPLIYYINTGRAPTDFLKLFINTGERQKATIANRLIKYSGNYEKAIDNICAYLGFIRNKY